MIGWLIIACEIGFWVFVISGLLFRYVFKKKTAGSILLICTPIVDLILLLATVFDLKNGAVATTVHGVSAIYLAASVVYGHRMIQWADKHFAYRFAKGEKPAKRKTFGKERAKQEREGWYLHGLTWFIGCPLLGAIIFYIDNSSQTAALYQIMLTWSWVLFIDFLISFSYTLFPKKELQKKP
nr:hypothetical protein [uncultured Bacillus sp.]